MIPIPVQSDTHKEICYSFVCKPKETDRNFLKEKLKSFPGLNPKIHIKLLKAGHSVTLDSGQTVTPDDVCAPQEAAQCLGFVFAPDSSYLKDLIVQIQNNFKEEFYTSIYHSVPYEVMFSPEYLKLISSHF